LERIKDIHWQEFEVLAFKILQNIVAKEVHYVEGGSDKGRDIIFDGSSESYRREWSGKWNFQVKHKSSGSQSRIKSSLSSDLKNELKKVFVTNSLTYDNYILVTNVTINGSMYDELVSTFTETKEEHDFECSNFDIISYRHLETSIEKDNSLKWSFPNIISHPDFQLLIQSAVNFHFDNRNSAWLKSIEKQRVKFVNTQFFERANVKLEEFPAIILSGPPKSGKTFNGEMIALNYGIHKNYSPILVHHPDDIHKLYNKNQKQLFVCDDAFGKHSLSMLADDWFRKLETVLELTDNDHKLIFTSREYVFRAFQNLDNDNSKKFLEKIIVESHNYPLNEKLAILHRYTFLSSFNDSDKNAILNDEISISTHKNFSPETIRSFFSRNIENDEKGSTLWQLHNHLDKPDDYLSSVFFSIDKSKQAALLAVLCTESNTLEHIFDKYSEVCQDMSIERLASSEIEFNELDDSILRILNSDELQEIRFYHPSMQEFLIRMIIGDNSFQMKEIIIKNINSIIVNLSFVKSQIKSLLRPPNKKIIKLITKDLPNLKIGLSRLTNSHLIDLQRLSGLLKWCKIDNHITDVKFMDKPLFTKFQLVVSDFCSNMGTDDFYFYHQNENIANWIDFISALLNTLKTLSINFDQESFKYVLELLKRHNSDPRFFDLAIKSIALLGEDTVSSMLPDNYNKKLIEYFKPEIANLASEIYGDDFPEFKKFKKEKKINPHVEKIKNKPNREWYPRFKKLKKRINLLKEIQMSKFGQTILSEIQYEYSELALVGKYAENRHKFIVKKGWWVE